VAPVALPSVPSVGIELIVATEVGAPVPVAEPSTPPVSSPSPLALKVHAQARAQARAPRRR